MVYNKFKHDIPLQKRIEECSSVFRKYNEKIPVIVQSISKEIKLKRHKYLVSKDISFSQFMLLIRKNLEDVKAEDGIFFFTERDDLINGSLTFNELHSMYKDKDDNYLYVFINKEATFGFK